jgi:hypothetical protein
MVRDHRRPAAIRGIRDLSTVGLRHGVEIEHPVEVALEFLQAYGPPDLDKAPVTASFDDSDVRRANRGGARIAAAEMSAILRRRGEIGSALREIGPDASLTAPTGSIPWIPLKRLFDAFAEIRGVGFSKMTKALHPKRPALIPMLDSVVQEYLAAPDGTRSSQPFGDSAIALVRSYKRDLDRNRSALREIQRELASRTYGLTEVRILDILIWSASATAKEDD